MATTISIMIFRANCTGVCLGCTLGNVMAKLLTAIAPLNMEVIIYSVASQTHIYYISILLNKFPDTIANPNISLKQGIVFVLFTDIQDFESVSIFNIGFYFRVVF